MDINIIKQKLGHNGMKKNSKGIKNWIKVIKRAKQINSFDFFKLDTKIIKQKFGQKSNRNLHSNAIKSWIKLIKTIK